MKKCQLQQLKLNILLADFFIKHTETEHHIKTTNTKELSAIKNFYKKERIKVNKTKTI
jgi:hypothetical protein